MNVLQSSQNTPVKPLGHKHVYTLPLGTQVAPFLHGHWEGAYKKVIILHFSLNVLSYDSVLSYDIKEAKVIFMIQFVEKHIKKRIFTKYVKNM
jgi:hypothetical protein